MKAAKSKAKKKSAPKKPSLSVVQPAAPAPAPAESTSFLSNGEELNEFAALKSRIEKLEERDNIRKMQIDDFRISMVVLLNSIQKIQTQYGVQFIPAGSELYGIKF